MAIYSRTILVAVTLEYRIKTSEQGLHCLLKLQEAKD